jgi:hypothetical protein
MVLLHTEERSNPARLLVGLILALALAGEGFAQLASGDVTYLQKPVFRIPFTVDPGERLYEVQLYVSEDQGVTWQKAGAVAPDQREFSYRAERNGSHWFTVRTVGIDGKLSPPNLQGIKPQVKVVVDTQPPVVTLRQAPVQEGTVGVTWDIRDDNLDIASMALEYRMPGSVDWLSLPVMPQVNGQRYWTPSTNGAIEVRLRVRDLAKNEGEGKVTVSADGQLARQMNSSPDSDGTANRTAVATRFVNSKQISLNYKIEDKGPSGVSVVELWATRDGRSWDKVKEDPTHQPPFLWEVTDAGKWGFTLIVKSGVNQSERPPHSGDAPQVWVEVDLTKPVVQWVNADVGRGIDAGKVTITWKAEDQNFGSEPITLLYAKEAKGEPQGPWTEIAGHLSNNGRYEWQLGPNVPYSFFVRVEAVDKAGNIGNKDTQTATIVDLHIPKGTILDVAPAGSSKN